MSVSENFSDGPDFSPRAIAEYILEQTRRGLIEDRFDLFHACVAIPTLVETFEATREIRSEPELRDAFRAVRRYYSGLRVTDLDRRCIAAEASGHDRISFTYESRLLEGPRLVQEPYPVFSTAELVEGHWKVVRSSYAIVDQPRHIKALTGEREFPGGGLPPTE